MDKITIDGVAEESQKRKKKLLIGGLAVVVVLVLIGGIYTVARKVPPKTVSTDIETTLKPTPTPTATSEPKSKDFGLVIDKINANAPIIKEVDPNVDSVYYKALENGVAQWKGTPYPDQPGNMFVFGHSSFFANAKGDYKDIFAPLDKVENGDKFDVWYNNQKYTYEVVENKVVKDTDFSVLDGPTPDDKNDKTITLMTCWPPKTIDKRRVVFGKQI